MGVQQKLCFAFHRLKPSQPGPSTRPNSNKINPLVIYCAVKAQNPFKLWYINELQLAPTGLVNYSEDQ